MRFLENFNTKIFHAQSEEKTQTWGANMIGRDHQSKVNMNFGRGEPTLGLSQSIEHILMPIEFTKLRKGGPKNEFCVDAYVFQNGRLFSNGHNFIKTTFKQNSI